MMNRRTLGLGLAMIVMASTAFAQEGGATFTSDLLTDFERASDKIVQLAEAMPEEKYSWRPAEGVRSVSEVFMHFVGVNYLLPGGLGASPPEGLEVPEGGPMALLGALEADVTEKDEVIAQAKASIEYAMKAIPQIEDLETEVSMFGFPGTKRAYLLILLTHAHEHLGQAIAYARSNGVVPPWSQAQGN